MPDFFFVTEKAPIVDLTAKLVVGIANEYSIAYGCARAFRDEGAELAVKHP
jgi:enoyl-[acyl-carrier protein] reductase I